MSERTDKDLELWKAWKKSGSMSDLETLMRQMMPVIKNETRRYENVVPAVVLDAEAKQLAKKAFDSYSPSAGTQLSTHVVNQLKKLSRTFYERQSTVHVPEYQRVTYNKYRRAVSDLEDELGYPPTIHHVADYLVLPVKKLKQLVGNVEKHELLESGEGPSFYSEQDDTENIELAYHDMTQLQKNVFDLRTGSHGKKELDNTAICKKLSIPQWQLSQEVSSIKALLRKAQRHA